VSNLAIAAPFIAAGALLSRPGRRRTILAAVLLAGGGLAHPAFLTVGAAILGGTAALSWRGDRSGARRTLAALSTGVVAAIAGLLASRLGGPAIAATTSIDAFLRRGGFAAELRSRYLDRLAEQWPRHAPWASLPLAAAGLAVPTRSARRFLVSWLAVTAVGVPVGALTGWYPPGRVLTFAFCVPILAALGAGWLASRRSWLVRGAAGLGVALLAWASVQSWTSARVFVKDEAVRDLAAAVSSVAGDPPGTPLVFLVHDPQTPALFLATITENLARAAVPPERARDVHVFIGSPDELFGGGDRSSLEGLGSSTTDAYSERARRAVATAERADVFALPSVYAGPVDDPRLTALAAPPGAAPGGIAPSSPGGITAATTGVFALLTLIGLGWARWAVADPDGGDPGVALAIAPAVGTAVLAIVALVLERIGVPLDGRAGSVAASALAALGGLGLAAAARADRAGRRPDTSSGAPHRPVPARRSDG
jgi:hypothetical protein